MGRTRVDLHHLLEDLRDAYPGSLEETVLTEILANALDSGASLIRISADSAGASLTIADNGSGMQRRELARYHDLASSTKTRGTGIGFAGVGIKLGLLACREVITETCRGRSHVATQWHLSSRHKAPWNWVPPPGMVAEQGTAVKLALSDPLSPLVDGGLVEAAIRRHYQPLLDPAFDGILSSLYPRGVTFEVNGEPLRSRSTRATSSVPARRRIALGGLAHRSVRIARPCAARRRACEGTRLCHRVSVALGRGDLQCSAPPTEVMYQGSLVTALSWRCRSFSPTPATTSSNRS